MIHKKAARQFGFLLILVSLSTNAHAQFVADASDSFGNSSFASTAPSDVGYVPMWTSDGGTSHEFPDQTAGGTYTTNDFRMRTPDDGESYSFDGQLIVNNTNARDGGLMYKGTSNTGVITIADLVLNGGHVANQNGVTDIFQLAGGITVQAASTFDAKQGPILISSSIAGAADLTIAQTDIAGNAERTVSILGDASGYSGNIDVIGHLTVGDTGGLSFDIGASGTNNAVSGTGVAAFDGMFNFDLSGASSTPGDSWTIANVTTQTFGATFSVGGSFAQVGSVWTDGTYTFNPGLGVLSVAEPPREWGVDIDNGLFSDDSNWAGGGAPTNGEDAMFGGVITANRTVLLDSNISLNRVTFANNNGDYFLAPQTNEVLTLVNEAAVNNTSGRHWLSIEVAGVSGITKQGAGELILDHANSFSGGVTVADGRLSLTHPDAIPSGQNVELTAETAGLYFGGDNGFFVDNGSTGGGYVGGTMDGVISGAGSVIAGLGATVTLTGANTFSGTVSVEGTDTTLTLSGSGSLGLADGTTATQTRISDAAQLVLDSKAVGNELLYLDERALADTPAHLSSSGTSSWAGNIKADIPGDGSHYKIESTSGTLTLSGTISAWDEANNLRVLVIDGAGNTTISGSITDYNTDANGDLLDADMNGVPDAGNTIAGDNIDILKRGSGTLTISTGGDNTSADGFNFHRGTTVIEEGTLAVVDSQTANAGELFTSVIDVRSGATFDTSAFDTYNLQVTQNPDETPFNGDEIGQLVTGTGTINTGSGVLGAFEDSVFAPGESGTGTLTVNGNLSITPTIANPNGGLNYELDNTTTVGGGVNDLITVSNTATLSATGSGQFNLNVTPVSGNFASGSAYTLITAGTIGGSSTGADFNVTAVNGNGDALNTRQTGTVSISGNSVTVTFAAAASRTWNGTGGNSTWDVAASSNWSEGDNQFRDLDDVTFGSGGTKDVQVNSVVTPGSTTFDSGSTYTFTGTGGIAGSGVVNVNAGTVKFQNSGNNYSGATTVAAGARLETDTASTGAMVVNGTLMVGDGLTPELQFTYVDSDHNTNMTLADGSPLVPAADIWEVRNGIQGNLDTIYEADADDPATAPETRTTITGLTPNTAYTVYANFWDATGSSWRVQAGDTSGNLTTFANPDDNVDGATPAVLTDSLSHTTAPVTAAGNRTLYSAPLGEFTTDGSGNLVVFIDDTGTATGDDRTFFDGLSFNTGTTGSFAGGQTLTINGDLSLNTGSSLELDLAAVGFDMVDVLGQASLEGSIDVSFLGTEPENGSAFTILSATDGITTPLENLDFGTGLPANFTASYNDAMTELILTYAAGLLGDFNSDGIVNLADYTVWRDNLGANDAILPTGSTDDGSGIVDAGDYATWKANFGATAPAALEFSQSVVPEPASLSMFVLAVLAFVAKWRRCRGLAYATV